MPIKVKNEKGEEIEVMTPEEVEVKLAEGKSTVTKEFETKMAEQKIALDKALAEKLEIEAKIAAGGNQTENFKILKEALDKKDNDIKELSGKVQALSESGINITRDGVVAKYSKGDKELEKKILHHFNETLKGVKAESAEEIAKKVESAAKLSIDAQTPGLLDMVIPGAGGRGTVIPGSSPTGVEFAPAEKSLGNKMGISEEDYKKYGPKLQTKR